MGEIDPLGICCVCCEGGGTYSAWPPVFQTGKTQSTRTAAPLRFAQACSLCLTDAETEAVC